MSPSDDRTGDGHVPPDGSAWEEAQRTVAERNEQTRKLARQEREAYERDLAAQRAERERGRVER